ncbi:hypothetical protein P153DRAFT_376430 [Dothidotthia symphoricarpi CBS 119687]|uniref:tRNA-splicing endonuclease subunit Sen15 domain-containing protein n=1 Tax=Dothidotthia symphoricarpi CBS 119687 TaxID=1392245 RepID=A0A6A6AD18_9PLEO|nr:uncharacterized protein P153DRAFT_376430 [Dothidotthia symphoricarpi CBS 119687]KAF2129163.1 hypothetical protein P153DRAFT_376430 [Dothidotthia symphoricarpi CBS 119687]
MTTRADTKPAPLQSFVSGGGSSHLQNLHTLARQIQHNLQHQHHWSRLQVHTHSPLSKEPLPRPLVSGLPPQRLYVHPDEQIELLKNADRARKAAGASSGLEVKAQAEREWVLPTRLNEKWTLRRLALVFDAINMVPPALDDDEDEDHDEDDEDDTPNPWRTTKRVVLATADSDSTVVYYIMHDGVVKPRQN